MLNKYIIKHLSIFIDSFLFQIFRLIIWIFIAFKINIWSLHLKINHDKGFLVLSLFQFIGHFSFVKFFFSNLLPYTIIIIMVYLKSKTSILVQNTILHYSTYFLVWFQKLHKSISYFLVCCESIYLKPIMNYLQRYGITEKKSFQVKSVEKSIISGNSHCSWILRLDTSCVINHRYKHHNN